MLIIFKAKAEVAGKTITDEALDKEIDKLLSDTAEYEKENRSRSRPA